jgi:hypothetical protein
LSDGVTWFPSFLTVLQNARLTKLSDEIAGDSQAEAESIAQRFVSTSIVLHTHLLRVSPFSAFVDLSLGF